MLIYLQIEEKGLDAVNVREVLLEMRKFRMGLIQTPDQLRFSYWAIIEGSNKYLNGSNVVSKVSFCSNILLLMYHCHSGLSVHSTKSQEC